MRKTTLDLPSMFDGLTPKEAKELSDRIAIAIIRAHEEFVAERMAGQKEEVAGVRMLAHA